MISRFLREQKRYTQKDLCDILECTDECVVPLIRKLKEYGVLKAVKASELQKDMSELVDEDIAVADVEVGEDGYFYVFTFVGVITIAGRVLKCYPKYLLSAVSPLQELRQVLKVLEKFNSTEQIIRMFNDSSEDQSFNLLAVLLFLLNDYYENGTYANTEEVIENNGPGEILWEKTINETFTFLSEGRPYYTDLQTRKHVSNDFDYFKRLHECILTKASKELVEADLSELFDITEVDLSDEELDDFDDKEYILYRIEKELNIQFNTRKQILLKTMYAYIDKKGTLAEVDSLSMFGTNSFNRVWEEVCKDIFNNQLYKPLGALTLPVPLKPEYNKQLKLIELIEKPYWSITGLRAKNTLIPDAVTIENIGTDFLFVISDAKYYTPFLEEKQTPRSQPGIESVTKQYLYQLAYQQFIHDHGFNSILNCFIMPTESSSVVDKGNVSMTMLDELGLASIQVRFLPAATAYDYYLSDRKMSVSELRL